MMRVLAIAFSLPLSLSLASVLPTIPAPAETRSCPTAIGDTAWGECYRDLRQGLVNSAVSLYRMGIVAQSSQRSTDADLQMIPFETEVQGNYSGVNESFEKHIRNESDWERFWQQLQGNTSPGADLPEIDFEQYSLIAVGLGDRPDGSYSVEIDQIRREDNRLIVDYIETRGCGMATMAITQPYQIVRIEHSTAPVSFQHHQAPPDC
ncbi:MAG: protease complex subunit PrcB family protein [Phormidium sp.]